ncbi:MAG: MgtC/SapB family protein [Pseudomonadota bacterium]
MDLSFLQVHGVDPWVIISRIFLAMLAGALIGLERTYNGRPAGFRTHTLVSVASTLLMLLTAFQWELVVSTAYLDTVRSDPTRLAQGIMTGIGFLGAGVIMKEDFRISGLTTAASIWITSAIGILIGIGFYLPAIIGVIVTLGTLSLFRWLEQLLPTLEYGVVTIRFLRRDILSEEEIKNIVAKHAISVSGSSYELESEGKFFTYKLTIRTRKLDNLRHLAETLHGMEKVCEFSVTPTSL